MPAEMLRVWYGEGTTPPTLKLPGSMYVTTTQNSTLARLWFDLGNNRYEIQGNLSALTGKYTVVNNGTEYTLSAASPTTVHIGNDLVVHGPSPASAAAMTAAALTNGNVYISPLYQVDANTWAAKRSIKLEGQNGVTVTTDASGNLIFTGTTYTVLPNPSSITFTDNSAQAEAAGASYNGNAPLTVSYNTVGAAAANAVITAAAFGDDNKTLTLTRAAGNITVELPATAAISISGNAATATEAARVTGAISLKVSGTEYVSYRGVSAAEFDVTYAKLGPIPVDYLPATALERLYVAATVAAIEDLTTDDVQPGDVVKNQANGEMYYVVSASAATAAGAAFLNDAETLGFVNFKAGTASSADVATSTAGTLTLIAKEAGTSATDISLGFHGQASQFEIPLATAEHAGLLSNKAQEIAGNKVFKGDMTVVANSNITGTTGKITAYEYYTSGGSFHGALQGNASSATVANHTQASLTVSDAATGIDFNNSHSFSYNGSTAATIAVFLPATAADAGAPGFVPAPPASSQDKFLNGYGEWWSFIANSGISRTLDTTNHIITLAHTNVVTAANSNYVVQPQIFHLLGPALVDHDNDPSTPMQDNTETMKTVVPLYDANGHIISVTQLSSTFARITYTPNSNFNGEGYHIGTLSDGTTSYDLYGGIVWGTF